MRNKYSGCVFSLCLLALAPTTGLTQNNGGAYLKNYFAREVSDGLLIKLFRVQKELENSARGDDPRTGLFLNLWKIKADLNEPPEYLTATEDQDNNFPRWSPDGKRIAFLRGTRATKLWLMDADGGNQRALTDGSGSDRFPLWSPDGERIAFVRNGALRIASIAAGKVDAVSIKERVYQPCAWSQDGRGLLLAVQERDETCQLMQLNVDSLTTVIVNPEPSKDYKIFTDLRLHPSEDQVLYDQFFGRRWDVILRHVDDKSGATISESWSTDLNPDWSPDGAYIVYASTRKPRQ